MHFCHHAHIAEFQFRGSVRKRQRVASVHIGCRADRRARNRYHGPGDRFVRFRIVDHARNGVVFQSQVVAGRAESVVEPVGLQFGYDVADKRIGRREGQLYVRPLLARVLPDVGLVGEGERNIEARRTDVVAGMPAGVVHIVDQREGRLAARFRVDLHLYGAHRVLRFAAGLRQFLADALFLFRQGLLLFFKFELPGPEFA